MNDLIIKIMDRIRYKLAPSLQEINARKYFAAGGDARYRFSYDLTPNDLVLDLGGYQGQWASDIFARYLCRIEVFEPVPEFAERIQERFKCNDRVIVNRFALGGSSRKDVIKVSADGSSMFGIADDVRTIEVIDIADWLVQKNITSVELMKVNVEGAEYELLERLLGTGQIRMIKHLQVQFHDFMPNAQKRMREIQDALRVSHYPTYQYDFVWENWDRKKSGASMDEV